MGCLGDQQDDFMCQQIVTRTQPVEIYSARERCGRHHGRWSRRLEQRYASMTPDEQEKMRNALTAASNLRGPTNKPALAYASRAVVNNLVYRGFPTVA